MSKGTYTKYDFAESISRVRVESPIARVIAAWGDSPEGGGSWHGGFLCELRDGRLAYITGWCDYTGWGCQDGAYVHHYDSEPEAYPPAYGPDCEYGAPPQRSAWDENPADLNGWIARGMPESERWD